MLVSVGSKVLLKQNPTPARGEGLLFHSRINQYIIDIKAEVELK